MRSFRVAAHVHSVWSYDGRWELSNLANLFRRLRYRAVLMTEHDRGFSAEKLAAYRSACDECSDQNVLLIPGIEYSDETNTFHILTWGPVPFLGENRPTSEILAGVKAHGGIAVLAHPSRKNAGQHVDPRWMREFAAVEVWNRKSDGWAPSMDGERLCRDHDLLPFVGMDFHTSRHLFPLSLRIGNGIPCAADAILEAIRLGGFSAEFMGMPCTSHSQGVRRRVFSQLEQLRQALAQRLGSRRRRHPAVSEAPRRTAGAILP